MEAAAIAKGLASARVAIGGALVAAPGLATRGWIGPHSGYEGAQLLARTTGARDLAIGAGILTALPEQGQRRRWLEAAALADGVDLLATLAARRALPATSVAFGSAMAGASALAHLWLRRELG